MISIYEMCTVTQKVLLELSPIGRLVDLLTSRAFERVARSYERGARASETTLRKSRRLEKVLVNNQTCYCK